MYTHAYCRCRNPLSSYVILGRSIVMALLVGSLYFNLDLSAWLVVV